MGTARVLRLATFVFVLSFVLFTDARAFAQMTFGSLTGQVTDTMGAAVVGAQVTLTNIGTNYSQTAKTDDSGVYLIKLVSAGNYKLAISAKGFADYIRLAS